MLQKDLSTRLKGSLVWFKQPAVGKAFGANANVVLDRFNEVVNKATKASKVNSYWAGATGLPELGSDGVHFTVGYLGTILRVRFSISEVLI